MEFQFFFNEVKRQNKFYEKGISFNKVKCVTPFQPLFILVYFTNLAFLLSLVVAKRALKFVALEI